MLCFRLLPAPTQVSYEQVEIEAPRSQALMKTTFEPPPYGHRQGFLPKKQSDFGDGGAFPEIHIAQYPLVNIYHIVDCLF